MDDLFDDPIADLLSEGSNDSFFEDPKTKKSTKPISNVFDVNEDTKKPKDIIPTDNTFKNKNDPMESLFGKLKDADITKPRERRRSIDKDDINDLLDITETKKSKASVMNEILGISNTEEKKVVTFDDILKSSKIDKTMDVKVAKKVEVEVEAKGLGLTIGKEPRRGRRGSQNLDPLGLLDTNLDDNKPKSDYEFKMKQSKSSGILEGALEEKPQTTTSKSVTFLEKKESLLSDLSRPRRRSSQEHSELPDWLKGGSKSNTTIEPDSGFTSSTQVGQVSKDVKVVHANVGIKPSTDSVQMKQEEPTEFGMSSTNIIESLLKQQKLSTSSMEIQNSSLALQQQESQLMMALQLKKYEQNLAEMQKTQQDILVKQEQQFSLLIEKQLSKQQSMEENMRLQQERINNHIQLLLSQPSSVGLKQTFEEHQKKEDILKETFEENRMFYHDIINSLKQKHHEEISLLEESYKKQLNFLEMSLESTETRLKSEIDNITSYYNTKLIDIAQKNAELIEEYELKIKKINEQNEIQVQDLKENYNELMKGIKNEYQLMIEDIRSSKKRNEELISNAGEFTDKLNSSIEILQNNTMVVNELQVSIKNERNFMNDMKTESLNVKEQEIKMMKESLEKQRLASDNERAQMIALVRSLEMKLVEQTQAAREEQWTLQQATATIAARALAMDREMEYIKNNLEYERQQLKVLKENQLAEHEKIMLQLNEEKLLIASEKSRLSTTLKLNQNFDLSRGKAEIEAALQVAKEATELTDRERSELCKQRSELEILKRTLSDREKQLYLKEDEVRNISRIAEQKYKDGERYMMEAKTIETKCTDKMREIQRHSQSLAIREKKLAEEKIELSKERLAIHTQVENRCSLCKVDGYQEIDRSFHDDTVIEQGVRDTFKNDDMEILRLRYELDDNIPTSEKEND